MKEIKLRGHHIDKLKFQFETSWLARAFVKSTGYLLKSYVYGLKFAYKEGKIFSQLTPDSLVTIVEGADDVCNNGCPYYSNCLYQNPDNPVKSRLDKVRRLLRWDALGQTVDDNDDGDKISLDKHNLKIGETYTIEDILKG